MKLYYAHRAHRARTSTPESRTQPNGASFVDRNGRMSIRLNYRRARRLDGLSEIQARDLMLDMLRVGWSAGWRDEMSKRYPTEVAA